MIEKIQGIPNRIAALKAKLKARDGKSEFKDNVRDIKLEITRLEAASQTAANLADFLESEATVASDSTIR